MSVQSRDEKVSSSEDVSSRGTGSSNCLDTYALGGKNFRVHCRTIQMTDEPLLESISRGVELLTQVFLLLVVEC